MKRIMHILFIALSGVAGFEIGIYLSMKVNAYLAAKDLVNETEVYLESISQS